MLGPDDLVFFSAPVAHVPLLDRLAPVRAAGFAGISLLAGDIWAMEQQGLAPIELAARIADHGLQIAGVECIGSWLPAHASPPSDNGFAASLADLTPDPVLAAAAAVGAHSVTLAELMGVRPSLDEATDFFAAICDKASDHGLRVEIEFLPFGGIPDLASAWAIVQAAGRANSGLLIDSWHLYRSGSAPDALANIPGQYITALQISDAPATPAPDLMTEAVSARLLPGAGAIDIVGMIRILDRIGSAAPVGVEIFSQAERSEPIDTIATSWAQAARATIEEARGIS